MYIKFVYGISECKKGIYKKKFYSNKVDTFKLTFDSKFNGLAEEDLIKIEMARQIDKSVNNAIGTFHEEILGGIEGYKCGRYNGYDVKADDGSLFAEIKNKHNTMNSSSAESAFQKLARFADNNRQAKCYLVQIFATKSFTKHWSGIINRKEYSHSRVYLISGDQFYDLLSKNNNALFELYKALPKAISDFKSTLGGTNLHETSVLSEIIQASSDSKSSILDTITKENYPYYKGFENL